MQSPSTILPTQSDYSNNSLCLPCAFDFTPLCWAPFFSTMLFLPSKVNLLSPSCPTRCYLITLLLFAAKLLKFVYTYWLLSSQSLLICPKQTLLPNPPMKLLSSRSPGTCASLNPMVNFHSSSYFTWHQHFEHSWPLALLWYILLPRHTFLVYSTGNTFSVSWAGISSLYAAGLCLSALLYVHSLPSQLPIVSWLLRHKL